MNILVINGSPNGEKSVTLKLTKAFLEGMGETAEIVKTSSAGIKPCLSCYSCWFRAPGSCCQRDGATEILEKIKAADLVIWSIPLFCYGAPSDCKALMDRTLSFNSPAMYAGEDGRTHHPGYEDGSKPTVLISSAGLPDVEGNFDGLVFQLKRMFGEATQTVLCAEGALLMFPETQALTLSYLEAVRRAGAEYRADGKIAQETQKILNTPMLPREAYIANLNRK